MAFIVNKSLIWDYDFSEEDYGTEEFRRFYVGRVLARGSDADMKGIGLEAVRLTFPTWTSLATNWNSGSGISPARPDKVTLMRGKPRPSGRGRIARTKQYFRDETSASL